VLTSGYGPEGNCITNDVDDYTYDLGAPGDPDLDNLVPGYTTYDASSLTFEVTAHVDGSMTFSYIFGSEEYNEWVGSAYNDVFGFYINGQNVAFAPGGIAVSINTINLGSNDVLYTNNDFANPQHSTQYDGYVVPLVTQAVQVTAGQTYQIKLAIADAGDHILDSIVYIKTHSLAVCPTGLVFCNGECLACCPVSPPTRKRKVFLFGLRL
jgi:hypothetical protein